MAERTKLTMEERAKQFAPFSAVSGLDILLRKKERETMREERRVLLEERAEEIDTALKGLSEGSSAAVTYYDGDGYVKVSGEVTYIDKKARILRIEETDIEFDDIYDIV